MLRKNLGFAYSNSLKERVEKQNHMIYYIIKGGKRKQGIFQN